MLQSYCSDIHDLKTSIDKLNNSTILIFQKGVLESFKTFFKELGGMADNISGNVTNILVDVQEYSSNYFSLAFKVYYSFLITTPLLIITFLSLEVFLKKHWSKYIIHGIWNISMIGIIIGLVFGGICGILSTTSQVMVPVIDYLLGPYLTSGGNKFGTPMIGSLIDTCINGDGNLLSIMMSQISISGATTFEVENIYDKGREAKNYAKNFQSGSKAISEAKNYLSSIQDIGNFSNVLTALDTKFNNIKTGIEKVPKDVETFLEQYEKILGEEGKFEDLFKCTFLRNDLISFCDQFSQQFSNKSKTIEITSFVSCLAEYIGIYFAMIALYHYSKSAIGEDLLSNDLVTKPEIHRLKEGESEIDKKQNQVVVHKDVRALNGNDLSIEPGSKDLL